VYQGVLKCSAESKVSVVVSLALVKVSVPDLVEAGQMLRPQAMLGPTGIVGLESRQVGLESRPVSLKGYPVNWKSRGEGRGFHIDHWNCRFLAGREVVTSGFGQGVQQLVQLL
jgi:hypothetical protein